MDRFVDKIAGLGVSGVMFLVAMSVTGLSGTAAITAALALLEPGGMIGGIVTLGVSGIIAATIAEYGFDAIFKENMKKLYANGESKASIRAKIEKGPWSKKLKVNAVAYLEKL